IILLWEERPGGPMTTITLPNLLWYGNEPRQIVFPDRWRVEVLGPPGFEKPALDADGIERAFARPVGSPTIEELAKGAGEVAVVFDDITRPTPVSVVLPPVLRALRTAGVPDSHVRFIPALGMHGAMHNIDFRKKLGDEVVRRFPVYNHNPYENCEHLGSSPSGIPVYINREFNSCDLKIGIGCITPHVHVGFGGGGKIVLPGIAGEKTIKAFHKEVIMREPGSCGLGLTEGNVMAAEVTSVVRMSGLDLKLDALVNDRGQATDLFAGDPVAEYRLGVETARDHYRTSLSPGKDIVVVNAYAKYNEMAICMLMGLSCINYEKATIVLVFDAPEGQVCHYLMRSFGREYGGECYIKRGALPETLEVLVCTSYPDRTMCDLFAPLESVTVVQEWAQALEYLERKHPGQASVGVIPDGTMQYFG
ncbi:MAG: lactate racemase domain-containing protein, partial [Actinomycetota bacterium]